MGSKSCPAGQGRVHKLTKHEIDRRLDDLLLEVLADPAATDPLCPRWISAAELVRRVRPFIVLN